LNARTRGILIAGVGFILILAAALFISNAYFGWANLLASPRLVQPKPAESKKANIVVLKADKFLGDLLAASDVTVIQAPVEVIPRDSISNVEDVVGKFLKSDMAQGEMILKHNLADPTNKNSDIAYILGDKHVLYAFPVSDTINTEGIVRRGDIVDLFATMTETVEKVGITPGTAANPETPGGNAQDKITRTFTLDTFQKMNVTALVAAVIPNQGQNNQGQETSPEPTKKQGAIRSYLLALPPQDALILKYLTDKGTKFDVVVRAPTSTEQFELTPVTEDYIIELFGLSVVP
jgi:Flp pilus assembly protein CpaB